MSVTRWWGTNEFTWWPLKTASPTNPLNIAAWPAEMMAPVTWCGRLR